MTKIEWTDESWNPIVGCSKVSAGCLNCYAEKMAHRIAHIEQARYNTEDRKNFKYGNVVFWGPEEKHGKWNGDVYFDEKTLTKPLHWKKPRMVFANSMGDMFHPSVLFEWIDKVLAVMALCPQHTFQVLTKHADRMLEYFTAKNRSCPPSAMEQYSKWTTEECIGVEADVAPNMNWPLPNLWLGVTAENQEQADKRIPILLQTPAAVRFVSCEPMLEAVDFQEYWNDISWYILGCESGAKRRKISKADFRKTFYSIDSLKPKVFVKQMEINGKVCTDINQFPQELQVREYPNG